jgi:hypothetical protein
MGAATRLRELYLIHMTGHFNGSVGATDEAASRQGSKEKYCY